MARAEAGGAAHSEDALLGGRVRLRQPADGYRAAIDPVLLAAAVPARSGERVLDVGMGSGAAALCLAVRVSGCRVSGLERDPGLADLARHNVALNGLGEWVEVFGGDLLRPPAALVPESFDHVMANPPYLEAGRADVRATLAARAAATVEGEAKLADWLAFCVAMAAPGGTVTVIHRADRLDEVLAGLSSSTGKVAVLPLLAAADKPAKRVIVGWRRGGGGPVRLAAGLVLHEAGGGFTAAAEAVLREAAVIEL